MPSRMEKNMNVRAPTPRKPHLVFTIGKGLFAQTGGSQKSVCEVASLFARDGYPTTIIFQEAGVSRHDKPRFDLDPRVRLINVARWSEGAVSDDREPGARDWAAALDRAQPDLVIIWFVGRKAILAVHDYLRDFAIPFICAHRMDPARDFLGRSKGADAERARQIMEGAAAHSVQTPEYIDFFPAMLRRRVWTTPNIVHEPTSALVALSNPERKVILNVGRLHAQKNQALLIRAFACIAHLHPDWDVHIYGDGPDQADLQALIRTLGMEGRIVLQGVREDLGPVYRSATLFAFSSIFEGFSRAHSEAMSYGLPSVGLRNCTSSRWLIGESGGGCLADNAALSFARELNAMMSRPQELERLGRRAADYVTRFGQETVFGEWKRMVETVMTDATAVASRDHYPVTAPASVRPCHVAFSIGAFKSYVGGAEKSLSEIASYLAKAG